jgi:hypothetical protein
MVKSAPSAVTCLEDIGDARVVVTTGNEQIEGCVKDTSAGVCLAGHLMNRSVDYHAFRLVSTFIALS